MSILLSFSSAAGRAFLSAARVAQGPILPYGRGNTRAEALLTRACHRLCRRLKISFLEFIRLLVIRL